MTKSEECKYCNGKGYIQLVLSGTETCVHCHGNGWLPLSIVQDKKAELEPIVLVAR